MSESLALLTFKFIIAVGDFAFSFPIEVSLHWGGDEEPEKYPSIYFEVSYFLREIDNLIFFRFHRSIPGSVIELRFVSLLIVAHFRFE